MMDDDDESYAADFATYQTRRLLRAEVAQFLNPITYSSMVDSPTVVANPVRHLYDFIGQSFTEGVSVIGLQMMRTSTTNENRTVREG